MQLKLKEGLRVFYTFICFAISGKPDEESKRFAHFPNKNQKTVQSSYYQLI